MKLTSKIIKKLIKEEMQTRDENSNNLVNEIVSLIKETMKERGVEKMDEKDIEQRYLYIVRPNHCHDGRDIPIMCLACNKVATVKHCSSRRHRHAVMRLHHRGMSCHIGSAHSCEFAFAACTRASSAHGANVPTHFRVISPSDIMIKFSINYFCR